MRIEKRIANLEARMKPKAIDCPVHMYRAEEGPDGDTRGNCPTCAAMTAEEYAEYELWCSRLPSGRVTHVVICESRSPESDNESAEKGCAF